MKTENESNIRDAEHHRNTARANFHQALEIRLNILSLRIRGEAGDLFSAATADALEEVEKIVDYDVEISAYEYRAAVCAVRDAYAGDGTDE